MAELAWWSGGAAESPGWAALPVSSLAERLGSWVLPVDLFSAWGAVYAFLAVGMFWFGSVLPDIDSKGSILGRMIRVPGPHHGITHTDWFLGLLFLASLPGFTRVLFWLWLGAALHCWMDGLSQSGRVRFYPLGRYTIKSLPNGGGAFVVASGNRLRLYQVGDLSETVALLGILGLNAASVMALNLT